MYKHYKHTHTLSLPLSLTISHTHTQTHSEVSYRHRRVWERIHSDSQHTASHWTSEGWGHVNEWTPLSLSHIGSLSCWFQRLWSSFWQQYTGRCCDQFSHMWRESHLCVWVVSVCACVYSNTKSVGMHFVLYHPYVEFQIFLLVFVTFFVLRSNSMKLFPVNRWAARYYHTQCWGAWLLNC